MVSPQISTLSGWLALFHRDPLIKLGACTASVAVLWLTMHYGSHPLALPLVLSLIPASFHGARLLAGASIADLQLSGWLLKSEVRA